MSPVVVPAPRRGETLTPEALRTLAAAAVVLVPCTCGRCQGVAAAVRWPWCAPLLGPWGKA